jgi:hypothetical protein
VYKWKARLNIHGGKQEHGVNYWDTYSSTLSWPPIRFILSLVIINWWQTRQIDFTLAYPQADLECDMYMDIPKGLEYEGTCKTHCLLLVKNLYGQKQAGQTWQLHLRKSLLYLGFEKSNVDECVFYRGSTVLLTYVDDCILAGPSKDEIDACIRDMSKSFNLTDKGDLSDYLGIKIAQLDDGRITLTQPHLIDSIIADLKFVATTKPKDIPSLSSSILQRDLDGEPFDKHWEYRSVIGKLNFLEKSTRPDLA